ncbi:hypothetical protein L5I01_17330 [Gordonia sp. HY442]|uniref:hypothetical protein n=1 Tax=Gordonia zhenghanii TaxID=2911516 RepID=UPI001F34FDDA|nr:hypothetical protein [Gordonia zhenghanii]MCF8605119.1 hypothetical protein [Gordonia zhenghanii]
MSHFAFYDVPEPVDTQHGQIWVGIGESIDGVCAVSIVVAGQDRTDIHLSPEQADALCAQVSVGASALRLARGAQS